MNILLQENNKEEKVVFLFGPTAVGKTELLCSLFSSGYEVVNADSVQVYRGLDIGSAKADAKTQSIIPHHLIDILNPWEKFNVADFIFLADDACKKIRENGNIPVISGGTAYYFKHFMFGLSDAPKSDPEIRKEVAEWIAEAGLEKAHEYLCMIDPVSGSRINVNDSYRISRAIEVYRYSGKPLSDFKVPDTIRNNMKIEAIGLCRDKEQLRVRIEKRVDQMFEEGLVAEIGKLLDMGASSDWQSMQGIGYKEFFSAMQDGLSLDELDMDSVKEQIVMNSVHYAKRQMTFFRSFSDVRWVEL